MQENPSCSSQLAEEAAAISAMRACFERHTDIYDQLNALRDYVNQTYPDFELYLEDVWNEHEAGKTRFEYILRSRKTLNETDVLGYDVYLNHQDKKGIWHLDDYQYSVCCLSDPALLLSFMKANQ